MKRNLSLSFLLVFVFAATAFAQVNQVNKVKRNLPQMPVLKTAVAHKTAFTGFETLPHGNLNVPLADNSLLEIVGSTGYDLQSNGGVGERVYANANGDVTAVFTYSAQGTGWSDRGTGYNTRSAATGLWGPAPAARLETERTGFTNLAVGPDGTEYITTHAGGNKIKLAQRPAGGSWSESYVPTDHAGGQLWSRVAVGGANGKTIHVIAETTPTGNGGTEFQGMDGTMVYFRSQDGGATWDIKDFLLPGIDATNFPGGIEVEGYAIDANGTNVSIVTLNTWNDGLVFTSEDNGTTWTKRVMNDFPLEAYTVNTGYDPAVLPEDPNIVNPGDVFTSDGTADILVDDAGITHVWYGSTYVNDTDTTDAGWTFYPGLNSGIVYWNSTLDDNAGFVAGYCPDINGNDTLDAVDITNYGIGLSSWPSGSIDADGNLYTTYSTVHELYIDANANFNFRQPFITASLDNGANWNLPKPIMDEDLAGDDAAEIPFIEGIFVTSCKKADSKVHCTFQADYAVYNVVNNSTNEVPDPEFSDNTIRYIGYPTDWAKVSTKNVTPAALKFEMMPNPSNDKVIVTFTSERSQSSNVEVYDMLGNLVRKTGRVTVGNGEGTVTINTSDLASGMYFVRLNLGNSFATRKLTVQH